MSEWRDIRRVLAVRLDNVGDLVMLTPALRALRRVLTQVHLTLMVSPAGSQVAPLLPWIDDVMVYRSVWQDASWTMPLDPSREVALVQDLHKRQFDAAFIFTSFSQSPYPPAYACYLAGISIRIGQSKEFGGSVLSQWVKSLPDATHQVDRNLHLLKAAGLPVEEAHMELRVPEATQAQADQILHAHSVEPQSSFIVMAPGASCEARRYDPARYAVVAERLIAATGLPILVVGSVREKELVQPILEAGGRSVISLVGETAISELSAVIRRARLVIANNSGPMHIADAFERPMVVLYSGTEHESQWRPRYAPTQLLRCPTDCSPCYGFRCPFHMECLDIHPSVVVNAALEMLNRPVKEVLT